MSTNGQEISEDDLPEPDYTLAIPKGKRLDPLEPAAFRRAAIRQAVTTALISAPMKIYEVVDLILSGRTIADAAVELKQSRMTVHDRYVKGLRLITEAVKDDPELCRMFSELGGQL